jgi:hypothetical protein
MPKLFRSTGALRAFVLGSALPAGLLLTSAAQAASQPAPVMHAAEGTDAQVRAYWTPERLRNAKPADLKVSGPLRRNGLNRIVTGPQEVYPGRGPIEAYDPGWAIELPAETGPAKHAAIPNAHPLLVGSAGYPYTSNRLLPDASLYKIYPYSTIGHLYFTEPSGDYQCSASVIRRNVIATAGHCVNDGSGHYYTNWVFIPADNGSSEPYGQWTWSDADTTTAWYYGGGSVPNAQDDALIVLNQQKVNGKGKLKSLGDVTGYLGYEYNAGLPTAIAQIGYPCNLDSCNDPVANYAQDNSGPNNNFEWGTYSFGGASGGPEIQDFGQAPSGLPSEILGGNILVSSTSYTYGSTVQVDGGSILMAPGQGGTYNFGDLINWACGFANAC